MLLQVCQKTYMLYKLITPLQLRYTTQVIIINKVSVLKKTIKRIDFSQSTIIDL